MRTEPLLALSDPGGVRPVAARWTITTDLVLQSATHLGGGAGEAVDMLLLRDAHAGGPLLPGTSLAGALRSHLADVLGGYRSAEDERIARLFGGARGDDLGVQSSLIVFDSLGVLPTGLANEIRDGIQIDAALGTAEDHKKFDLEVLPAGTRFPLRFDLIVPQAGGDGALLVLLVPALAGLSSGDLALGMRRSRGLGAVRADNWRAVRYDLTSRGGWLAWLLSDPRPAVPDGLAGAVDAGTACREAWPPLALVDLGDRRRRMLIDASLSSRGGLLVRSAPSEADAPDAVHLRSAGCSVLPGTSLGGALRQRALRIARLARAEHGDADLWIDGIFGPRLEGVVRVGSTPPSASRLRLAEGVVEQGVRTRPSRVRIDRFTQGVVPGALFDEEPELGGCVRVRMELRNPHTGEAGLLFLLLKDLLTGDLAVGGTSAVGRGLFEGTATAQLEDGVSVHLDPACSMPGEDVERVDREIHAFWQAPALAGAS